MMLYKLQSTKVRGSTDFLGRSNSKGPHYQFEVGNLEIFQTKLEEAKSKGMLSLTTTLKLLKIDG